MPRTWIEIDQAALRTNAKGLRALLGSPTQLMGIVKANAYGHGIEQVVPALDQDTDWFGVDSYEEAVRVRRLTQKPILIINPLDRQQAEAIIQSGFQQMISTTSQLQIMDEAAKRLKMTAAIHIKLDTGMSRQGVTLHEWPGFFKKLQRADSLKLVGIATHFANADIPNDDATERQKKLFFDWVSDIGGHPKVVGALVHMANSSATVLNPETRADMVRLGILLYGVWPDAAVSVRAKSVFTPNPVLTLKSEIAQIKTIPAGEGVGYGLTHTLDRETRVALLAIGYADGYARNFSGNTNVLLLGQRAPLLGRVSMNLTTVDVTDIPGALEGDVATLIGKDGEDEITAGDFAFVEDTIAYEVLARLGGHLSREIV